VVVAVGLGLLICLPHLEHIVLLQVGTPPVATARRLLIQDEQASYNNCQATSDATSGAV
jgi:hypothetical protein